MKKILIVEDDPDIGEVISNRLEAAGFETELVEDATLALEKIEKNMPDLITLDILMPGVVGGEGGYGASLCETLKEDEQYAKIPIVMVSALDRDSRPEISEMVKRADAYFKKPFDSEKLIQRINEILNL